MNLYEKKRETAKKIIDLLAEFENTEYCRDEDGFGWVEIDGTNFNFNPEKKITSAEIAL